MSEGQLPHREISGPRVNHGNQGGTREQAVSQDSTTDFQKMGERMWDERHSAGRWTNRRVLGKPAMARPVTPIRRDNPGVSSLLISQSPDVTGLFSDAVIHAVSHEYSGLTTVLSNSN